MKKLLICTAVLCTSVLHASAQKTTNKTAAKPPVKAAVKTKAPVMKNLLDSFSYAAGYNIAMNMKAQGIKVVNIGVMQKAIEDVFTSSPAALTPEMANTCIDKQMQNITQAEARAENARGIDFLEKNKKRKEVTTLPDGLQYEVIKSGDVNGVHPTPNDTVVVNFIGSLVNGQEFENTYKSGQMAAFPVMGVIKGWSEVLQLMKPGDHWKVYLPTELGYGSSGSGTAIPPNAALVFEMVLEGIRPYVEKPKTGQ